MTALRILIGGVLAAGLCAAAPAPAPPPEVLLFKVPVLVRPIGFKARYQNGKVLTSWRRYKRTDFKFYKLVRSSTMHDPVFPENGELFSTSNRAVTSYEDADVDNGIWYYRLCIITKTGDRWVSPVVEVMVAQEAKTQAVPKEKDFE